MSDLLFVFTLIYFIANLFTFAHLSIVFCEYFTDEIDISIKVKHTLFILVLPGVIMSLCLFIIVFILIQISKLFTEKRVSALTKILNRTIYKRSR